MLLAVGLCLLRPGHLASGVGWHFEKLRKAVHGAEVGVIGDNISLEGVVCGGVTGA